MSTESERNSILRQQVAELIANNARLRDALDSASYALFQIKRKPQATATIVNHASTASEKAFRVLDEIQNESLAAIQADAIEKMLDDVMIDNMDQLHVMEYANNLRGRQ